MFINFEAREIFATVFGCKTELEIVSSKFSHLWNVWASYDSWYEYHEFGNGADVRLQVVSFGKHITPTSKVMIGVYHTNDVMGSLALFPLDQYKGAHSYYQQQLADN